MKTDTGEPPSTTEQNAVPVASSHLPSDKPWRPSRVADSFGHAWDGVTETFRSERNFRFHIIAAVLVLIAGVLLQLSPLRLVAAFFSIALVIITEIVNTAIEATVDLAMPAFHPVAKRAKDASAGAVLVAAICAAIVGAIVFLPALMALLQKYVPWVLILPGLTVISVSSILVIRRNLQRPGSSLDLSRKVVIGVALLALGVAGASRIVSSVAMNRSAVSSGKHSLVSYPALPVSAGVP